MFLLDRPGSAMSEMSIHIGDHDIPSRAESRMEAAPLGDAISQGHLNIHSNLSSRRGSEFQNFMSKEDKNVSSWLNKNDDYEDEDRDLTTPVNQLYSSGQASDPKPIKEEQKQPKKPESKQSNEKQKNDACLF